MEKTLSNNKYRELAGLAGFIAKKAGCKPDYVRQVFSGIRTPKTNRAKKAQKVLELADQLLETFNQPA